MSDTKRVWVTKWIGRRRSGNLITSLCQNRGFVPNMVVTMMNNSRGIVVEVTWVHGGLLFSLFSDGVDLAMV